MKAIFAMLISLTPFHAFAGGGGSLYYYCHSKQMDMSYQIRGWFSGWAPGDEIPVWKRITTSASTSGTYVLTSKTVDEHTAKLELKHAKGENFGAITVEFLNDSLLKDIKLTLTTAAGEISASDVVCHTN